MIGIGQIHIIDQYNLQMSGNNINNDISNNTYYNALDSCNISWIIIKDSLPSEWDFSICFPNCYNLNVAGAQELFLPNEQVFLNCHMYPNGQEGEGFLQMEITTNNIYKDTVTWNGSVFSISFSDYQSVLNYSNRKLIKIFDLIGKNSEFRQRNQPLLYIYDDGTVKKRIVIE